VPRSLKEREIAMRDERLTMATRDGEMGGYLAQPDGAERVPGVVVIQEAFGVTDHIRDVCRRFADAGYAALAPELFHRERNGIEVSYSDVPSAMQHLQLLTNDGIEQDLGAALAALRARPEVDAARVGMVGFCVGGFAAFLGATRLDPAATLSLYGGGIVRPRPNFKIQPVIEDARNIRAPILCMFGAQDQGITPGDVEAIRKALDALPVPHEVVVYPGAGHAFFCDQRASYHAPSAHDAWQRMQEFLGRHLAARG